MSDSQRLFEAVVRAKDESSSVIEQIEKHYKSFGVQVEHAAASIEHAGKSIHGAGDSMEHLREGMVRVEHQVGHLHEEHRHAFEGMGEHVEKLHEHYSELSEGFGEVFERVQELIPAFGALATIGTAAGAFEAVSHAAESYAELAHTAEKIGSSADSLNYLHVAARLADTNVESLDKSLVRLNYNLGEVSAGRNKQLAANLKSIHFDPKDYKDSTQALLGLADAFQHASARKRTMMARDLGGRDAAELIPFLSKGRKGLEEALKESQEMTPSYAPYAKGLDKYNEDQKKLHESVEGFLTLLGGKLSPALDPLIEKSKDYIIANREWITGDIADGVKHFADALKSADWDAIGKKVDCFSTSAEHLADNVGHVGDVIEVLAGIMALRTVFFLATPITQTFVFGARITKLAAQLTGELAGAWVKVGEAAAGAGTAEGAALAGVPAGASAVDVATNRARNLAARDAATLAGNRVVAGRAATSVLLQGEIAYETLTNGTSLTKQDVRNFPGLARQITRDEFDTLPNAATPPSPILGITGDKEHPGWLERALPRRDDGAPWYSPHRWIGIDSASDSARDASLSFRAPLPTDPAKADTKLVVVDRPPSDAPSRDTRPGDTSHGASPVFRLALPSEAVKVDFQHIMIDQPRTNFSPSFPQMPLTPLDKPDFFAMPANPESLRPLPSPWQIAQPSRSETMERGRSDVYLHIPNLPPGTTIETSTTGSGPDVKTDLGYNFGGEYH